MVPLSGQAKPGELRRLQAPLLFCRVKFFSSVQKMFLKFDDWDNSFLCRKIKITISLFLQPFSKSFQAKRIVSNGNDNEFTFFWYRGFQNGSAIIICYIEHFTWYFFSLRHNVLRENYVFSQPSFINSYSSIVQYLFAFHMEMILVFIFNYSLVSSDYTLCVIFQSNSRVNVRHGPRRTI